MIYFILFFSGSLFLIFLLVVVSHAISEYSLLVREELSSYECGFEHNNLSRLPFSFRYFFLTLMFLLFDLEVVLMLFIGGLTFFRIKYFGILVIMLFVVVLAVGLFIEIKDGNID